MNSTDVLAKKEEELVAEIAQKKKELKLIRRLLKRDKPTMSKNKHGQYPLGVDQRLTKDIKNTFYKILKWNVETMRILGKRGWYDCLGYIRGIRIICTYLEELNPDIPDEQQPPFPTLTGVTLDMENTKWVEVEASVIDR